MPMGLGISRRKRKLWRRRLKKTKDDLNKWKDIVSSWIRRLDAVKVAVILKLICRCSAVLIKMPTANPQIHMELYGILHDQNNLEKE